MWFAEVKAKAKSKNQILFSKDSLLLTFRPTILFVEHDKTFCDKIATKVVQF